jgi:serine protease
MRARRPLLVAVILGLAISVAACGPFAAAPPAPAAAPPASPRPNGCTAAQASTNVAPPLVAPPLSATDAETAALDAFATAPALLPDGSVPLVTVERAGDQLVYTSTAVVSAEQAVGTATAAADGGDLVAVEPDTPVAALESADTVTASASNDAVRAQQWALDRAAFESVWPTTSGSGVIVAVVDTGVQANHPDLAGQVLPGYQFLHTGSTATSGPTSPAVDDHGHGTHVAGIIAAVANNAAGVAGAAPGVKILPVKALSATGGGWDSDVAAGIGWAVANGAKVVNLSVGGGGPGLIDVAINDAVANGVIVFAAAGNGGAGAAASYPGAGVNAIAVASVDSGMTRSSFSNTGGYVDLAAPGGAILSTAMGSGYSTMSGTSMATPYAAALGALVRARYPAWTVAQVRERILTTADDLGTTGKDVEYGCGFLDPVEATG